MLPEFKELESRLDRAGGRGLDQAERERVWQEVARRLTLAPVVSPYWGFIHLTQKTMMSLAIALVVLLGAGGTVAAADSARPGDILFPIDRAVEEAHIAVTANAEAKAELRARFAEERVAEFEAIVDEETKGKSDDAHATTTISAHGEARVENALSVLEGFMDDAHIRASSTAHARSVLEALDARFEATLEKLPSDLRTRIHGNADVEAKDEREVGNSTSTEAREKENTNVREDDNASSSTGVDIKIRGGVNIR